MLDSEYRILVCSEWSTDRRLGMLPLYMIYDIVHHKNKSGDMKYCALHMSFNTAITLLLSFTFLNLVFRSFDHEKRS